MARDEIKELILTKAKELILANGGFTIKELTEATHVNIAAVNYHFGSKDNLTKIIVRDLVDDLKKVLSYYITELEQGINIEDFLRELVTILYDFTVENAPLLRYLFVTIDSQQITTNELVEAFFSENEFTTVAYGHLANLIGSTNPKEIAARYMIFFVSGAAPMIFELMSGKKESFSTFKDEEFKNFYIAQMIKLLS